MAIADQLRAARRAAGLTQAQLAQLVGVADGTRVAAWEHGRAQPHPRTWAKVCEVLGIEASQPADMTLKELRLQRGMTVKDVAVAIGVHASTVARWEDGSHEPSARHAAALREVLGAEQLPRNAT